MAELFTNDASSTLNGAINNSVTSLAVTSASSFPSTGNFRIKIDNELMLVTAVSSNTFTVTRGIEGTAAASHITLSAVTHVVTSGSLDTYRSDTIMTGPLSSLPAARKDGLIYLPTDSMYLLRDNGSSWDYYFNFLRKLTPPDDSQFAWVNQGTSTVSTANGGIFLLTPASQSDGLRIRKKAQPTPPYSLTVCMIPFIAPFNFQMAGIGFRESSTGKCETVHFINSTNYLVEHNKWNSPSSFNSGRGSFFIVNNPDVFFLRITHDGTNLLSAYSNDGYHFRGLTLFAKNNFFTTGPDEIFFCTNTNGLAHDAGTLLLSWKEDSSALSYFI